MKQSLTYEAGRMQENGFTPLRLVRQLSRLYVDLDRVFHRDPEQEITGIALPVIDHLFATARKTLENAGSAPPDVAPELISPETLETGAPIRAVDALLVTGQILAVLGDQSGWSTLAPTHSEEETFLE